MAEEGSADAPPETNPGGDLASGVASSGLSMEEITAGLVSGQSKSKESVFMKFTEVEEPSCGEGKNKLHLVCQMCKCRVLRPGFGTLVEKEVRWVLKEFTHCVAATGYFLPSYKPIV